PSTAAAGEMTVRYAYSAWDGSQEGSGIDPDSLLGELTDELLAGGDLDAALRRLLRSGMRTQDGERLMGMREMLERLRRRRAELLAEGDPDGRLARIAEALDDIVAEERGAIDELEEEARGSGDERRASVTSEVAAERRIALDLLPGDVSGRVRALQHYEFVSSEARERFNELLEELRQEVADTYFRGMSDAMRTADPEQLARMRDAFDRLNRMIEQRARGEELDPSFEAFMEEFGDLFPGATTLDELLEQLAQRMAAADAMWRSMSKEQRNELRSLAESLLEDVDLRWQVERLAHNLRQAVPDAGWGDRHRFSGDAPLGLGDATDLAQQVASIERAEDVLRSASSPASLGEIDLEEVSRLVGEDVARSMERLARLARELEEAGYIEHRGGHTELTPKGVRRLGQRVLADLFTQLRKDRVGDHQSTWSGSGHDREETSRPYQFGDPFTLDLGRTVHNAVRRSGTGVPVRLDATDFEIVETEALSRSATVVAVDLSMSMPMRDNFVPAKKMAMALHALISTRFPRDYLGIVGFSAVAREIPPEELPTAMWDYVYGTNLQHALLTARTMLAHQHGTKQIIVVTDGEPTAHIEPDGEVQFNYPPVPETLRRTMAEVVRCTRAGITINVFALDIERTQFPFVEQIARVNGGRTFSTTPETLGSYVLVDFLRHRRTFRTAG
ncbi:MAG TPA: VWA domain-containing protein, partial [Acidimicrobiales bacterium]|nr:VWA domain-containing protein [Acidimicrobiales bacterium]